MKEHTVYTIGHGNQSFSSIAGNLDRHGIATIVDVRSVPWSRHAPDFTRPTLDSLAQTAGFGYRWLGDRLGGRPDDPALTKEDGTADYDAIARSPGYQAGLDAVEGLAEVGRVVLLCSEARPDRCHRALLLAHSLEQRGFTVVHILPDGQLAPHQPELHL